MSGFWCLPWHVLVVPSLYFGLPSKAGRLKNQIIALATVPYLVARSMLDSGHVVELRNTAIISQGFTPDEMLLIEAVLC